jgi:hypothetical protein
MSLQKYGYDCKVLPRKPTIYDEAVKKIDEVVDILWKVWVIKQESKTLDLIRRLKGTMFSVRLQLARGSSGEIGVDIVDLKKIDIYSIHARNDQQRKQRENLDLYIKQLIRLALDNDCKIVLSKE